MFALADAVLLRPLPFFDANRLVVIEEFGPQQSGRSRIELRNFYEWTVRAGNLESMAAVWTPGDNGGVTMISSDGVAETVPAQSVTPEFFGVFRVVPLLGRTFRPDDESPLPQVAVLSESFWRRRFDSDAGLIGRSITLDGRAVTVIGVVPASFEYLRPSGLWTLLPAPRANATGVSRGQCGVCRLLQVVARLKPEASPEGARAELTVLTGDLAARSGAPSERRVTVEPLRDVVVGLDLKRTSILLLGIVSLLLLVCGANVASVLLAQGAVLRREFAIRSALGANRRHIAIHVVTETVTLAVAGGLVGLALAAMLLSAAPALLPAGLLPGTVSVRVDLRVTLFAGVAVIVVGMLVGLAQAWRATAWPLTQILREDGRTGVTRSPLLRGALTIGQVAIAVIVLVAGGLFTRTLVALDRADQGYAADRSRILTANLSIDNTVVEARYANDAALVRLYQAIEQSVQALPGVERTGWGTTLPLGGSQLGRGAFYVVGDARSPGDPASQADYQIVSPGYFHTLGLPLIAGRPFLDTDSATSVPVCIVSEGFVQRFLRGKDPLRTRIAMTSYTDTPVVAQIVGIARQVKEAPDEREPLAQIYLPNTQRPWPEAYLVVRSAAADAVDIAPAVRAAVANVDRQLPLDSFITLETIASGATGRYRLRATLVMAFALLSLALAMVGVFGVLALSIQQRWRELAVRIALGATRGRLLGLVLGTTARLVGGGLVIGFSASLGTARLFRAFLFDVRPIDPITLVTVGLLVAVAGLVAAAVPTLRVGRLDPVIALRSE